MLFLRTRRGGSVLMTYLGERILMAPPKIPIFYSKLFPMKIIRELGREITMGEAISKWS